MSSQNGEQPSRLEPAEDAWERITAELAQREDNQLWTQLSEFASYRGGNAEHNLTLAGLVHTLAERDQQAAEAFQRWQDGPGEDQASGHIVAWMLQATSRG